jgi:CelD/BcsL family acetyltransferase involved in cellulose biosynthesis
MLPADSSAQVIMPQATHAATHAAFDAPIELDAEMPVGAARPATASVLGDVRLAIHTDLAAMERDWRAFEMVADGTVFQSFDWLSIWQRHIGVLEGVVPAIVTRRDAQGRLLFLLPLSSERAGMVRRLTWLGSALCDYNGPLLARDFTARAGAHFMAVWRDAVARLQAHQDLGFHVIALDKMQSAVGSQPNPFMALGVSCRRRLSDAPRQGLGHVLRREAVVGDTAARPQ